MAVVIPFPPSEPPIVLREIDMVTDALIEYFKGEVKAGRGERALFDVKRLLWEMYDFIDAVKGRPEEHRKWKVLIRNIAAQ